MSRRVRKVVHDGWNVIMELDGLQPDAEGHLPILRQFTWGLDLSGLNGNNLGSTAESPAASVSKAEP